MSFVSARCNLYIHLFSQVLVYRNYYSPFQQFQSDTYLHFLGFQCNVKFRYRFRVWNFLCSLSFDKVSHLIDDISGAQNPLLASLSTQQHGLCGLKLSVIYINLIPAQIMFILLQACWIWV